MFPISLPTISIAKCSFTEDISCSYATARMSNDSSTIGSINEGMELGQLCIYASVFNVVLYFSRHTAFVFASSANPIM